MRITRFSILKGIPMSNYTHARLGHHVIYVLSEYDVRDIRQARVLAGRAARTGNDPQEGDLCPAVIVRDHHVEQPLPSTIGDIQWVVGAHHDGRRGEETIAKIRAWQEAHGLFATGDWGPAEEEALKQDRMDQVSVNLQVFLDGTDSFWATSRSLFLPHTHGTWARVFSETETPDKDNPEDWTKDPKGHFFYA